MPEFPDKHVDPRPWPKAELHLHLEGTVGPDLLWRLAQRHGATLGIADEADARALYQFSDFDGFIRLYKAISIHLVTPDDYAEVVREMARALAAQGIVYAEVFFSLGILLWKQVAVAEFVAAADTARRQAEAEFGVTIVWLADAVRQFGPAHLDQLLDSIEQLQASSIVGIGIGGDERTGPAAWFSTQFERARAMGLHTTAHAGETCGADSVWETIRRLRPQRIGHGLRACEDPALVKYLAENEICLDVCPTSNARTGCWPQISSHPAREFYKGRVPIAISSDDPGIFGVNLLDEYAILHEQLGFSRGDLQELAANSFRHSFLPAPEKHRYLVALRQQQEATADVVAERQPR